LALNENRLQDWYENEGCLILQVPYSSFFFLHVPVHHGSHLFGSGQLLNFEACL
jgi:hypothetical protein